MKPIAKFWHANNCVIHVVFGISETKRFFIAVGLEYAIWKFQENGKWLKFIRMFHVSRSADCWTKSPCKEGNKPFENARKQHERAQFSCKKKLRTEDFEAMLPTIRSTMSCSPNCKFSCFSGTCLWNLVFNIKSRMYAGSLQEQGAKKDPWTQDERGIRTMKNCIIMVFRDLYYSKIIIWVI